MGLPKEIADLIERFDRNREAYKSGQYNEMQLRQEFLDPFFAALGWDMNNQQGYAEAYKDVIHEDSIKVGADTKAPDYCFRIGGTRKFFLEAKKPSVYIKEDISPAFQLRRYAWSAKLPLSILTDFEEFAVYDARIKPEKTDKASNARIHYFTYKEYEKQWDLISSVFSREAVLKGSFDKYAEKSRLKKGTATVDDAFLSEIEDWRDMLAKNIALRNADLTTRELNFAVQRTIDRIVFLRICEDRGIEEYGRLQTQLNGTNVYKRLIQLFSQADDRYNSGLFHFQREKDRHEEPDKLTTNISIDDKPLKDIINRLYYPESPYEFSVLSADILGQVYEQFLGKVIRLTVGHQAKVEEKPEVRKAGGVYYTPKYIVDYIVKNTVGKLLEDKKPKEVEKLTILDPACGSGSFLLGAYQYLLDWHLKWYIDNEPDKWAKAKQPAIYQGPSSDPRTPNWHLTTAEKKRILLNNIYGVDIDSQAVEVTKLSLLLKVLEGENNQTLANQLRMFHERALPDLGDNIKCGNSLIGSDFYQQQTMLDDEERYRVNVFDWEKEFPEIMRGGGFYAVIGNPPWGAEFGQEERNYAATNYPLIPSKTKDSYMYFVSKAIGLLKKSGYLGFIIPNTWMLINNALEFRRKIMSYIPVEIIDFGDGVFRQATVESCTLILINTSQKDGLCRAIRMRRGIKITDHTVDKKIWLEDEHSRIILDIDDRTQALLKKLRNNAEPFELNCTITWGIKPYQVGHGSPPQTREMMEKRIYHATTKKGENWKPLLVGSDVNRYQMHFPGNLYIKYGKWLMYSSNEELLLQPKILLRQTSDILRACYDDEKYYCQNSVFIVHSGTISLKYLLGLINSSLLEFIYKMGNPQTGKVFAEIKPSVIKQLPIRKIDFAKVFDKARHDKMVSLVDRMLSLNKQLPDVKTDQEKIALQRQIDTVDRQIDQLVYELYGLTEEEIGIVETAAK